MLQQGEYWIPGYEKEYSIKGNIIYSYKNKKRKKISHNGEGFYVLYKNSKGIPYSLYTLQTITYYHLNEKKTIRGYKYIIYVDKQGNVYKKNKHGYNIIEPHKKYGKKYTAVHLTQKKGGHTQKKIINLVYEAFVGPIPQNYLTTYKNGDIRDNRLRNVKLIKNNIDGLSKKQKVAMMYNGQIIQQYISISEAARLNCIQAPNITKVCKGKRKTAGGYEWRYV